MANPGITIDRAVLKAALDKKKKGELARLLGVTSQAPSMWVRRGRMASRLVEPLAKLIELRPSDFAPGYVVAEDAVKEREAAYAGGGGNADAVGELERARAIIGRLMMEIDALRDEVRRLKEGQ